MLLFAIDGHISRLWHFTAWFDKNVAWKCYILPRNEHEMPYGYKKMKQEDLKITFQNVWQGSSWLLIWMYVSVYVCLWTMIHDCLFGCMLVCVFVCGQLKIHDNGVHDCLLLGMYMKCMLVTKKNHWHE